MKSILSILALVLLSLAAGAEENYALRLSVSGNLNREKTYFAIITNLDSQQFSAAEALFKTIPNTNGLGGFNYDRISRYFRDQAHMQARDLCLWDIHFWIKDDLADGQVPAHSKLLNDPDHLGFLQELFAYCQKFPAQTEEGRKSEASVEKILQQANDRKTDKKHGVFPSVLNKQMAARKDLRYTLNPVQFDGLDYLVADADLGDGVADKQIGIYAPAGDGTFHLCLFAESWAAGSLQISLDPKTGVLELRERAYSELKGELVLACNLRTVGTQRSTHTK